MYYCFERMIFLIVFVKLCGFLFKLNLDVFLKWILGKLIIIIKKIKM